MRTTGLFQLIHKVIFICHIIFVVSLPLCCNTTRRIAAAVTQKAAMDFSEHDILSGTRNYRRHEEKHFPLVKKIISDIF